MYSVVVGITCSYSIKFSILLIIFIGILHSDRNVLIIVKFWEIILIKNGIKFSKQLVIFNNVYVKLMVMIISLFKKTCWCK